MTARLVGYMISTALHSSRNLKRQEKAQESSAGGVLEEVTHAQLCSALGWLPRHQDRALSSRSHLTVTYLCLSSSLFSSCQHNPDFKLSIFKQSTV